jgi:MFS family permease
MTSSVAAEAQRRAESLSAGMTLLLAAACGLTAANIYYAQPLIGLIAPDVGLSETAASLIVTFTQVGYCLGLILLVPLGDLLENRSLIFWTLCAAVAALLAAAFAPNGRPFSAPRSSSASPASPRRSSSRSPRIWRPIRRAARRSAMS